MKLPDKKIPNYWEHPVPTASGHCKFAPIQKLRPIIRSAAAHKTRARSTRHHVRANMKAAQPGYPGTPVKTGTVTATFHARIFPEERKWKRNDTATKFTAACKSLPGLRLYTYVYRVQDSATQVQTRPEPVDNSAVGYPKDHSLASMF